MNSLSVKKFQQPEFRHRFLDEYPEEEFQKDWDSEPKYRGLDERRKTLVTSHYLLSEELKQREEKLKKQLEVSRRTFEIKARTIRRLRRLIQEIEQTSVAIPVLEDELADTRSSAVLRLAQMENEINSLSQRIMEIKGRVYRDEVVRRIKERGAK